MWEVDWTAGKRRGGDVLARDLGSKIRKCREWAWRRTDFLRRHDVDSPEFGAAWEVDWTKRRKGNKVWARNPISKRPEAREWRWVSKGTLITGGVDWVLQQLGKHRNTHGYVMLTKRSMSIEDVALCEKHGLFTSSGTVQEHRVVALKKYGRLAKTDLVRHINGDKADNRPENLLTGTHKENHTDHRTAVVRMMYWRERAETAERRLADIERQIAQSRIY